MWQIWLIFAGIFLLFEIITTGFCIFWLSIGSLLAMITSIFIPSILFQMYVFVISSTILIFATKPFTNKFRSKNPVSTNMYNLNGKRAMVIEDIIPAQGKGLIKVNGEIWSAICDNDITISKDSEVEIIKIEGVKAHVSPITVSSNK